MRRSLWMALALVAGLSVYAMQGEDDDALLAPAREEAGRQAGRPRPAGRHSAQTPKTALDPVLAQTLIDAVTAWRRRGPGGPAAALASTAPVAPGGFAWAAVAPPPAPPAAPSRQAVPDIAEPAPAPPAFPWEWVGRFDERAVLSGLHSTLVVASGDVIEGQWRVDGIQGRAMALTYLPLNQPQTVAMK